jgi:REP element-mobilizing transposase RayT
MIRKPATVAFWRGRLPHWEVEDGRYFVTLHLAGAIPEQGWNRIHAISAELEKIPKGNEQGFLNIQRRIFREMEAWLDRTERVSHLRDPQIAKMVLEAITHRKERRVWTMFEFVIMPNHLHLFFEVLQGDLKWVMEDFKRWTGHRAAKARRGHGGQFWQREWFDHWSRSDEEDERIVAYIRRNPVKAGLVEDHTKWPFGSWSQ